MGILEQSRDNVKSEVFHLERMVSNANKALWLIEQAISLFGATEFYTQQQKVWSNRAEVCSHTLRGAKANLALLNAAIEDMLEPNEVATILQLTGALTTIRLNVIEALE